MAKAEGIPPTASVVVPGLSLNYVGEYVYAYNNLGASTTSANIFKFTTGTGLIVGNVELNPQFNYSNGATGFTRMRIKFNDTLIGLLFQESSDFYRSHMNLTIPPFTEVIIEVISSEDTAAEIITVGFTGRVYDA
jgi:hypothetical protein